MNYLNRNNIYNKYEGWIMMKYPFVIIALSWLIGLIIGAHFSPLLTIFTYIDISIAMILLLLSFFFFLKRDKKWFYLLMVSIILFAFFRMSIYQNNHQSYFSNEMVSNFENEVIGFRGYIATKPEVDGNKVTFVMKPTSYQNNLIETNINSNEKLMIYLYINKENDKNEIVNWQPGMGIRLFGKLAKPIAFHNPGQFNYLNYLENKGIYWKITVHDISNIEVGSGNRIVTSFYQLKTFFIKRLDGLFTDPYAGFMRSILLGERNLLDGNLRDDFSNVGLSHLLAISGLHLSILVMLISWLLHNLGLTKEKTIVFVGLFLVLYMLITGASPSVVRATIMSFLVLIGLFIQKPFSALQILGIAFFVMSLYQPTWIYDVGFQLSFITTFFILWGHKRIVSILPLKNRILNNAISLLIITQTASFPLVFFYFHQYSLLSWLLNLIIVPFFSIIILPLGFVILVFASLHLYLSYYLAYLLTFLLKILFVIVHWSANIRIFYIYGRLENLFFVILIYGVLLWLIARNNLKNAFIHFHVKKYIFIIERYALIAIIMLVLLPIFLDNEGVITCIDVGQGDSILIETPLHHTLLIDSGGSVSFLKEEWQQRKTPFDIGEDVVLPYLHYRSIYSIDTAILTHEDYDHLGGFLSLIDEIEIDRFIVSRDFPRTERGKDLYSKIMKKGIAIVKVDHIKALNIDSTAQMSFIPVNIIDSKLENDHSFASILNMYNTKVAFASDLEIAGEERVMSGYRLPKVDILKVGHHGSSTSTSDNWMQTLQPKNSIISVGLHNLYNHPSEKVLTRLHSFHSKVWRTDQDGAIIIHVKKDRYTMEKVLREK